MRWKHGKRLPQAQPVEHGTVLFNTRLCGIMAGLQIAMIGLLLAGYRLPLPWGVAVIMLAAPFVGYYLAGLAVRLTLPAWRSGLLVGALTLNAGLLVALIFAVTGVSDPVILGGSAVFVAFLLRSIIHRAVVSVAAAD